MAKSAGIPSLLLLLGLVALGCQASANASVNTGGEAKGEANVSGEGESTPPPAESAAPAAPEPAPANACPISCWEAMGPAINQLTQAEAQAATAAVSPVMAKMHGCSSNDDFRRFGSPIVHLRIGPDGAISEVDVDPHHGHYTAGNTGCYSNAAREGQITGSFPGRKVIRCREQCPHEKGAPRSPNNISGRGKRRGR